MEVLTEWFRHVPEEKWLRDRASNLADANAVWEKLGLQPGVRVLECPCGKSDMGFPLARLGAVIEGIDCNSHFIEAAKNKFSRSRLPGRFIVGDMRTADYTGNFDLVLNWGSSFGFFSDENNAKLVRRWADLLVPGGRLLIEVANPPLVISGKATRVIASGDQVNESYDPESHRATVIFPPTQFRGPVAARIRIYGLDEYRKLLAQAGLELVGFFSGGFGPYSENGNRLIVMAQKN